MLLREFNMPSPLESVIPANNMQPTLLKLLLHFYICNTLLKLDLAPPLMDKKETSGSLLLQQIIWTLCPCLTPRNVWFLKIQDSILVSPLTTLLCTLWMPPVQENGTLTYLLALCLTCQTLLHSLHQPIAIPSNKRLTEMAPNLMINDL
jgi:hypothetical protein